MSRLRHKALGRFVSRDESGAVLVEFGLVMPFMLLLFAVMIEAGRFMWSYQVAIEGVRDAGRYLARVAPVDICLTGGDLAGYSSKLKDIVEKNASGTSLFPTYVKINSVTPSLTCVSGTYRIDPTPVGTVSASFTIDFPFSGIMKFYGKSMQSTTALIEDQARIFGQ